MWLQKIWSQHFLDIVSFLELVYTAACIHKLLLTGEERVALVADINFSLRYIFLVVPVLNVAPQAHTTVTS